MKAITIKEYGDASVLQINEVAEPVISENELLIKVKAAGVNPVDAKIRSGSHISSKTLESPVILGKDFSGIVEKIGKNVKGFNVGDAVFGFANHSYAEFVAVDHESLVMKPESLSFEEAAGIPLACLTAHQALHDHLKIKAGQRILIQAAAGGVGHFAVQLAKIAGTWVSGTASAKNIDFLNEIGVDLPIDYKRQDFEELLTNLDSALETMGGNVLYRTIRCIKPFGKVVCLPSSTKNDPKAMLEAKKNNVNLEWMMLGVKIESLKYIQGLFEQKKLKVYIEEVLPMAAIVSAHQKIESHGVRGKLVIGIN